MKVEFSFILSCLTLLATGLALARQVIRKNFAGHFHFYCWSLFLGAFGFTAVDISRRLGWVETVPAFRSQNALLGLYSFAFLAVISFALVKNVEKRKLRALSRLPIVGALLGWYLSPQALAFTLLAVEAGAIILSGTRRREFPYVWRAQAKAAVLAPLILFYVFPPAELFYVWFLWTLLFKHAVVNASIVKNSMLDYDKSLDEN